MNDHDLDLELKHRAKAETDPVPAGFEARLLTDLNDLPEQTTAKRPSRSILRPVLVAAAVLALTGTVLAGGAASGFDLVTFFGGTEAGHIIFVNEDGTETAEECSAVYDAVSDDLIYFPAEELPEAVREAADAEDRVILDLPTWESVEEFIGLDIVNSRTLEEQGVREDFEAKKGDGPFKTYQHMVSLSGEAPQSIQVHAHYRLDGIKIMLTVYIRTDAIPQELRDGTWLGRVDFYGETWEREDYLTAGGLETVLVHNLTNSSVEAVFTFNGMGYQIGAYSYDRGRATAALKEVLDGFQ